MEKNLLNQYGPWAMIAGGSEGIGFSYAKLLAAAGINLILLARREGPLQTAKQKLLDQYDVKIDIHCIDLTTPLLDQLLDDMISEREIGLFIYNAGAAQGTEIFHDAPVASALRLVDLNCRGPLVFCHKLGGLMRERGKGGIILMSSLAGLTGAGYVAAYSATKAFDIALAEGLWSELKPYGVDVLSLIAGFTDTPAMEASGTAFDRDGPNPPMHPDEVADEGLAQLGKTPVWVVGKTNREFTPFLRSQDRVQTIDLMTAGAAAMNNDPFPIEPT
ncbi:MAG: SDR family NAD(P)-dependent oxidoreductase [Pseudomonadales bacterium]|nr:SDR family NAD(P)-dependent oxidoreductase [Pseudomonadales bacterium]